MRHKLVANESFGVKDPIHKAITLTDKEKQIIDHPYFQRLRRIKALGFLDRVFPGAKHSRFEHSIGACHLAEMLGASIASLSISLSNSKWNKDSNFSSLTSLEMKQLFSEKRLSHLRIAALLHDVGHGPFSHASESIMPSRNSLIKANKGAYPFILAAIESRRIKQKKEQADHEDYSLLLLDRILRDSGFSREDVHAIACIKSRSVQSPKTGKEAEHNILISQLVDGEFDSDRLDYLLRDSYFCGVPYGQYDLTRLLEGICVVKGEKGLSYAVMRSSLAAFEHFLFARYQMHAQIYTHRVDASYNEAFKTISRASGYLLPASIEKYSRIDDENFIEVSGRLKTLQDLIRNRKSWITAFESYSQDEANDSVIIQLFTNSLSKNVCGVYRSSRPIKKQELLDLPVITKDFQGEFIAERIQAISQLISHYNAVFTVRRIFVHPKMGNRVDELKKTLSIPEKKAA